MTGKLLELCQAAVEEMLKAGADIADASAAAGTAMQAEVRENAILGTQSHRARSAVLRAIVNKRTGTFDLHAADVDAVVEAARLAVEIARNAQPDPAFKDLPPPEPYAPVADIYDGRVEHVAASRVYEAASANIETALEHYAHALLTGAAGAFVTHAAIANSHGVAAAESGTLCTLDFFCVLRQGDEASSFFGFRESRGMDALAAHDVALEACQKAGGYLGARSAGKITQPLLLAPLAAYELVRGLVAAASADAIQRERSFLCARLGRRIAPEALNVADDPLVAGGVYSSSMDGEGAPRRAVQVIGNGVLNDLLHSSYTANREGVANNGHGGRTGGVHATNVCCAASGKSLDDILRECGNAVLVEAGSLDPDPVSGKVNALLDYAVLIENGARSYPLKGAAVAGNVLEILAGIQAVGAAVEIMPGCTAPPILTTAP